MIMEAVLLVMVVCVLVFLKGVEKIVTITIVSILKDIEKMVGVSSETLGLDSESSKQVSGFAIEDMGFVESMALFQNPKSTSSSALLHVDVGMLFGGLI